jgi:hypothetical protein
VSEPSELDGLRSDIRADFERAVEEARRQPLPSIDDLTTDVLV